MTPKEFEFFVIINYFELKTMPDEQLGIDTNYIMKDGIVYGQYWSSTEEFNQWLKNTADAW